MAATYEFWLTDDYGRRITNQRGETVIDNVLFGTFTRIVNEIGTFRIVLPPSFDTSILRIDNMLQVWRAPEGGRLGLFHVYFLRKLRFETAGSAEHLIISGRDANDLLRRRIVAAFAGELQSSKDDYADDMMKEVVTESLADGVDPTPTAGTRVWADLSVAPDLGKGPSLKKGFAFDPLLTKSGGGVLAQIADAAREAGTEVFFDIVPATVSPTAITFEFRTYTGQPGQDVSGSVVFDQERGNLEDPYLEYDATDEANYVYACGGGQETDRIVEQVYRADRYNLSQWNRCEASTQAQSQGTDTDAIREAGRSRLADGRPVWRVGGKPLDTQITRFGIDWNWGYKVRQRYRKTEFDAIVRSVVIDLSSAGEETIQARMDNESN